MRSVKHLICLVAGLIMVLAGISSGLGADDYGKITIQELKSRLGDRNLIIMDVRDEISWSKSSRKIAGAVREDFAGVSSWAGKYPKNADIVVYCA